MQTTLTQAREFLAAPAQKSTLTPALTNSTGLGDYYFQNNSMVARTEFQNVVPLFELNEGGMTLGGPLIKNRLFAYGAIDVLRSSDTTSTQATVETKDFSNYVQTNFPNSVAAQVLKLVPPGNFPTTGLLSVGQVEAAIPGYYPPPNMPTSLDAVGTANINYTTPRDGYQWEGRVDQYLGQHDRIFASTMFTNLISYTGNVRPAFTPRSLNNTTLLNTGWTHTFSPLR